LCREVFDKFAGTSDASRFPVWWEMALVTGDEEMGFECLSAFKKAITLVMYHCQAVYWPDNLARGSQIGQQIGHYTRWPLELRTAKHMLIFGQHRF
jgi:hypothetical protein